MPLQSPTGSSRSSVRLVSHCVAAAWILHFAPAAAISCRGHSQPSAVSEHWATTSSTTGHANSSATLERRRRPPWSQQKTASTSGPYQDRAGAWRRSSTPPAWQPRRLLVMASTPPISCPEPKGSDHRRAGGLRTCARIRCLRLVGGYFVARLLGSSALAVRPVPRAAGRLQ
jgi:hypothetical protein